MRNDKPQHSELIESQIIHNYSSLSPITSSNWLEVSDIMTEDVTTIHPENTVVAAAKTMSNNNISCIIISDNGHISGIVTETDLLKRAVAKNNDFRKMKTKSIMSCPVLSIPHNLPILEASRIMEAENIRRLVVLKEEQMVGVITQTDVARALASYGMWKDISELMTCDVASIDCSKPVKEAAQIMLSRDISCLVTMEEEKVVGIFTERDLLKRVIALQRNPAKTILKDVMSSPAASVPPNYSVPSASKMMERLRIRRLLIMDNDTLLGIVTQTDIVKALQYKLQEEEKDYFKLLDKSRNCIYIADLNNNITYVNPALMELLEVTDPKELIDKPLLSEKFWDDPQQRNRLLNQLQKASVEIEELTLRTAKGKKLSITLFSTHTKNIRGQTNGSQGVLYDITAKNESAQTKTEEELRKAQNELEAQIEKRTAELMRTNELLESQIAEREIAENALEKLNRDLESTIRELRRTNKELQMFAYITAHDLKTPLRAIGTLAEWLSKDYSVKIDKQGQQQLKLLLERAKRADKLVDSILQYSSAGNLREEQEQTDLNNMLSEIIREISPPENIKIIIENELPVLICRKTHIKQIFYILLSNAIKYMDKEKGYIKIDYSNDGYFWKFSITDNGPGIDKKYYKKIFEMFQTLSITKEIDSTGIGLTIANKIVTMNNGRIWVESNPGEGSVFFFTLPKFGVPQEAYTETAAENTN